MAAIRYFRVALRCGCTRCTDSRHEGPKPNLTGGLDQTSGTDRRQQETIIIQTKRNLSLKLVSLACLSLCYPSAFAIGFGDLTVRSNIGDILHAQVTVSNITEDVMVASCFRANINGLDGDLLDTPRIEFVLPGPNQTTAINLVSRKPISEPAVKLVVSTACGSAVRREYTVLLDYPDYPAAVSAPVSAPAPTQSVSLPVVNAAQPVSPPGDRPPASATDRAPQRPVKTRSTHRPVAPASSEVMSGPIREPAKSRHAKVVQGRDALHVDNNDAPSEPDLKMSQTLSDSAALTTGTNDAQRLAANKQAQEQFAAILRGEDPGLQAQTTLRTDQDQIRSLQKALTDAKQRSLVSEQQSKSASSLITVLSVVIAALIAALAGTAIFILRRARRQEDPSWWDSSSEQKKNVVDIVDYLQSSAEEGNLDPATIIPAHDQTLPVNPPATAQADVAAAPAAAGQPAADPSFKRMGLPALEDTNSSTFNFFGNRGQSIQIEEISDITQEAEFWMSVNDPHRAIEILEPQSLDDNPRTPITWLYLLDLYRLVGDETNYRDLRRRFKAKFNARIPEFHEEATPGPVRTLEDFPHLISNITTIWKTDDMGAYLESLLIDDREGERIGFDLPVYREILFLLNIVAELKRHQYTTMAKKEDVAPAAASKSAEVLQPLEPHLIVKTGEIQPVDPAQQDAIDHGNTLNFDLLDFKTGDKKKS